jgi:tryptophanyl-tRNA synthetase
MFPERVVSGMRPTGALHLGHYHGALKNWVLLQSEYPCFFFVADWHALTTHYDSVRGDRAEHLGDGDRLAGRRHRSRRSRRSSSRARVPEHAELHLLLSMCTPLGWLERVPTYKDQQEKLSDRDLSTYGFLGYPLLQAADILMYRAAWVPVGEDQVPHIELTREVARRFNHLFGREPGFEDKAREAVKKLGSKRAKLYMDLRTRYQQEGDEQALAQGRDLLEESQNIGMGDRERLFGYLEGSSKIILLRAAVAADRGLADAGHRRRRRCPRATATPSRCATTRPWSPRRSARCRPIRLACGATIPAIRATARSGSSIRCTRPTRPSQWVQAGCRSAGIGCLECKQPVIDAILAEQGQFRERAQH